MNSDQWICFKDATMQIPLCQVAIVHLKCFGKVACHIKNTGSIPGQFVWGWWWSVWQGEEFASAFVSLSFGRCFALLFLSRPGSSVCA
jgi:hypothetical protein